MALAVLTMLVIYVVGISLMTTQVSYPLFSSVPAPAFVAYHARYNRRILPVIIVPAFPTFLALIALPFVRPDGLAPWAALLVAVSGAAALIATVGGAIPAHHSLHRNGFTAAAYRRLRTADAVRTTGCVLSAAVLIGSGALT